MSSHRTQIDANSQEPLKSENCEVQLLNTLIERKSRAEHQLVDLIGYRRQYESHIKLAYSRDRRSTAQFKQDKQFIDRMRQSIHRQQTIIASLT